LVPKTCHQCGASVAADEQFCPNCGAFIDPMGPGGAQRGDNVISVTSDGNYEEFSLSEPPSEGGARPHRPAPGSNRVTSCPSCGAQNPPNNRHCQECGARLSQAPLPTAPRPAVQATAGVRAALAISALLFGVIVVALLFNVFNGGTASSTTLTADGTTTTPTVATLEPIEILSADCSIEGIGSFVCDNVFTGTGAEYQLLWEGLSEDETVTIRLTFRTPMVVQQVNWKNLEDQDRFRQNYRARGIVVSAQNDLAPLPIQLEDLPGEQSFNYAAVNTNWIEFEVVSAFGAEVVSGNVFRELAIDEITVIGRPATSG
jgi:hypothetical protein